MNFGNENFDVPKPYFLGANKDSGVYSEGRVLVVANQDVIRMGIVSVLRDNYYDVDSAKDNQTGLRKILTAIDSEHPIHCVIVDFDDIKSKRTYLLPELSEKNSHGVSPDGNTPFICLSENIIGYEKQLRYLNIFSIIKKPVGDLEKVIIPPVAGAVNLGKQVYLH